MKINTALIMCAGFGKRLSPLTLETPKPLLKLNNITLLENAINMIIKLGIKNILINTFHLSQQIFEFIKNKDFPIHIKIIEDGENILDTGGGIMNMTNYSKDSDFLILNPDTIWSKEYIDEINRMQKFYFTNDLNNILLVTKKEFSFDQNLKGDFKLKENLLNQYDEKNHIFIGCQILNKNLFNNYKIDSFSIKLVWEELQKKNNLNGFESFNKFYHLTNLQIFKKLEDL